MLVVAVAGFAVYRVLHPSPHRSASSVAIDFYANLEQSSFQAAIADVAPAQKPAATVGIASPQVEQFVHKALGHALVEAGTTTPDGADTMVVVQTCRPNLSCTPALTVPTVQVGGAWYVDWATWLQGVPATSS